MSAILLDAVSRYATAHADPTGYAQTPIDGLTIIRATEPSGLVHAIPRPLVCLVLQGRKQVTMGTQTFTFGSGDSLLISADVPTASQIITATAETPYYSVVLELETAVIAELSMQMKAEPDCHAVPVRIEPTDHDVVQAATRLVGLLERPESLPVMYPLLVRELHYWLLRGTLGSAIRRLSWPEGHTRRIARSIDVLRNEFARPLRVEQLAEVAGMSPSSFHRHFRAVTSLSPLQFQKQLRLIEARHLMWSEGLSASSAAFCVGYESVPQFTREYGRMFGLPPARDTEAARREGYG